MKACSTRLALYVNNRIQQHPMDIQCQIQVQIVTKHSAYETQSIVSLLSQSLWKTKHSLVIVRKQQHWPSPMHDKNKVQDTKLALVQPMVNSASQAGNST